MGVLNKKSKKTNKSSKKMIGYMTKKVFLLLKETKPKI